MRPGVYVRLARCGQAQLEKQEIQKPGLRSWLGERSEFWIGEQEVESIGLDQTRGAPDHVKVLEKKRKSDLFLHPFFPTETGGNNKKNLTFARRQELILNVVSDSDCIGIYSFVCLGDGRL